MAAPQKTVIVAEDELLIRMLAADVLTDAGYHVIEACDAAEALAALHVHENEVVALFTDVHMPGECDGLELARLVREQWPRIAIMVASGKHMFVAGEVPVGGQFVTKPYELSEIVARLEELTSD